MSVPSRAIPLLHRLGAEVATVVLLLAGLWVIAIAWDAGVAAADGCSTSSTMTGGPTGTRYDLGRSCPASPSKPGSGPGSSTSVNLDPNREVCFYRPSKGGVYSTADAPAGQSAADGQSMDKYCGKASEIGAMQGAGDPMSVCSAPCSGQYGVWVKNGTAPTPQEVATALLATLDLSAPTVIHTNPDADRHLVVRVPTWLWIDGNDAVKTASDGPISIAARPTLKWTTSEGTVPCSVPGTPYEPGKSDPNSPSPDCGWTFMTAGADTITVTVTWTITVTGAPGVTFPPSVFSLQRDVRVDEIQTVNR